MDQVRSESRRYRWYVLGMLALTYAFSFMDRQILSILLEDIRAEFSLSDLQLGLLSGIAFALFYATLGVPIARLADRFNRVTIVSAAVTVWSAMTALCGAAASFWQLFLARVGVGIGEAGGSPPSHSIISDYFNKEERSFALAIYSLGTSLGMLFGLVMGGFVAEHFGWRWAFVCAGVPGLALALLLKLTVREPLRGAMEEEAEKPPRPESAAGESMIAAFRALWANRCYRRVNLAHMLGVFVGYGFTVWKPALYLRQFELSQSEVGLIVGLTAAGLGVPGMLLGGYLGDRLSKRDARGPAWLCAAAVLLATPVYLLALWSSDWVATTVFIGLGVFLYSLSHAPGLAIVQSVVEPHRRAQAAAYVFFLSNILGLGLGPVLVGSLSDGFAAEFDNRSLNVALGFVTLVLLAAAAMYWRTARALPSLNG
ncbi:MAG: MFS transporter [Gammaproteobacteria bacterium]|nr:MFS transporter [Gammaproteobacteria bacterium]